MSEQYDIARRYTEAGLSVLPVKTDGSKAPDIHAWTDLQNRIPTAEELLQWYGNGHKRGIAIIAGAVSGNLEIIDCEGGSPIGEWKETVQRMGHGDLLNHLAVVVTPSNGVHLYYRCSSIGKNQKLAMRPDGSSGRPKVIFETRSEGGYVLAPGCPPECHATGNEYRLAAGDLMNIPTITPEEREVLLSAARSFDMMPIKAIKAGPAHYESTGGTGDRPGDHYSRATSWAQLLEPHGWKQVFSRGEVTYWRRPGKDQGISATTGHGGHDILYVFTSSTAFEPGTGYTKFTAYAILVHNGDYDAAARELGARGFGKKQEEDFSSLAQAAEALKERQAQTGQVAEWQTSGPVPAPAAEQPGTPATGQQAGPAEVLPSISEVVRALEQLTADSTGEQADGILRQFAKAAGKSDGVRKAAIRMAAVQALKDKKIPGIARLIDCALGLAEKASEEEEGDRLVFPETEPWEEEVDGHLLMNDMLSLLKRFLVLPPHADLTIALWILFTFTVEKQETAPILAILSATKRCGKTRTEEILSGLVNKACLSSSISAASLFRTIDKYSPTILIDEFDAGAAGNEDLRCIINSGWRKKTAIVVRTVGDDHEPRAFRCFGPKVIAGIGSLPGTVEDRSIIVQMKRKTAAEKVDRLIYAKVAPELQVLNRKIKRWVDDHLDGCAWAFVDPPAKLNDRQADNWSPLLSIAKELGQEWLDRTISASLVLSGNQEEESEDNRDILLLGDIRSIFDAEGTDCLHTATICKRLIALEDRPWADYKNGKPISGYFLPKVFQKFGIKRKSLRQNGKTNWGYSRDSFEDAFCRYLPPVTDQKQEKEKNCLKNDFLSVTSVTSEYSCGLTAFSIGDKGESVTDAKSASNPIKTPLSPMSPIEPRKMTEIFSQDQKQAKTTGSKEDQIEYL